MNYFRLECNRMIRSKAFKISLIISAVIVLLDVGQDFWLYCCGFDRGMSVFEKWIGVRYMTYGSILWNFLFVVFVSIPFSCTLCSELKNHYALQIISKIGKKQYFFVKTLVSFISGFLVSLFTLFLDFLLLALYNRAFYPWVDSMTTAIGQNDFLSKAFYAHPYIYLFSWMFIICIWAGIFSVFTLTVGLFVKKKSIAIILTQILFVLQAVVSNFFPVLMQGLQIEFAWMGLLYGDSLSLNPWFSIFGSQAYLLIICLLIIYMKGKKYSYV